MSDQVEMRVAPWWGFCPNQKLGAYLLVRAYWMSETRAPERAAAAEIPAHQWLEAISTSSGWTRSNTGVQNSRSARNFANRLRRWSPRPTRVARDAGSAPSTRR